MREGVPRARREEEARGSRAGRRFAPALVAPFILLAFGVAYAATTFLVVSPTNLQGWQIQRSTSGVTPTPTPTPDILFVTGPATPPLGTGSAEFRMGPDGGGAAQLRHPGFAGTRLPNPSATATPAANELTSLSYSTFTQQDGSGGQSPYLILQIDTDGDAGIEDFLYFEPVYQSATFCPSNPQPALVTGQWQTWDAFNGCWYSVFGTNGSGPGTNTQPLRTLSGHTSLANAVIANESPSGLGGVRLVTGFGAGAWDNYVGNADAFRIGVGANDTVYNFEPNQTSPTAGSLLISEVRFRGPNGLEDEFVEIYNNSSSPHVVAPPDGSGGYALVGSDGAGRGTIPFGTVIPARGHYLFANSDGYSLGSYPAGNGTGATPDDAFTLDLPNDATAGVALFATDNPANFNGTILDAFGFTGAPALYREGTGFATAVADSTQHTYFRDLRAGPPKDTGNNAADFMLVSTAPATTGGGARLGAPGPENRSSPVQRNDKIKSSLIDRMQPYSAEPNSVRKFCSPATPGVEECNPNRSLEGTFSIRRRWTNNTGEDITRLRFRIVNITTGPTPAAGTADLRALTSQRVTGVLITAGGTVDVEGTTVEELTPTPTATPTPTPPASQPFGGGYNSTLAVGTIDLTSDPLVPNEPINLQFLFGVQQGGAYVVFVNVEAGPSPSSGTLAPARASSQPARRGAFKGSATRRR